MSLTTYVVTIVGAVCTILGVATAWYYTDRSDRRDQAQFEDGQRDRADEERLERGGPVLVSPGSSYYGGQWIVSRTSYGLRLDGVPFDPRATDAVTPGYRWAAKNFVPLGSTGTAVTLEGRHKTTVVVKGVRVTHRRCSSALPDGTLLALPAIGDGGDGAVPVDMGLDLDATRPVTRNVEGARLTGPFTNQVALDRGDAREFTIRFFTEKQSCTFRAELLVYSKGTVHNVPLPARWNANGKPASYVFETTAAARDYESSYVVNGSDRVVAVPPETITWAGQAPTYTGDLSAG